MGRIGDELLLGPDGLIDGQDRAPGKVLTEQEDEDQEDSRQDQENPGSSLQADSIFYVIDLCNILII